MRRQANSYRANRHPRRQCQTIRLIATALIERDDALLLVQLAKGPFAGFWLLPSSSVDEGTVEVTARRMVLERTGYPVIEQQLLGVLEEPKPDVLALRFVFRATVGEREAGVGDAEITQARWFMREAVHEVLEERDVVPNLGVMSLIRSWVEGMTLRPLELLVEDALCPCGSGERFRGCCGWDAK